MNNNLGYRLFATRYNYVITLFARIFCIKLLFWGYEDFSSLEWGIFL